MIVIEYASRLVYQGLKTRISLRSSFVMQVQYIICLVYEKMKLINARVFNIWRVLLVTLILLTAASC